MKKAAAISLLLFFATLGLVRAQSSIISQMVGDKAATDKLYFSLKLGLSCGTLKGSPAEAERLGGFNAGFFATIRLGRRLSLVAEVLPASRKGVSNIPFSPTGDPDLDAHFDPPDESARSLRFVDVPVLLKFRPWTRLHFAAGGFVGFLLSAKEGFKAELADGEVLSYKRDVKAAYRSKDFGVVAEVSYVLAKPRRGDGLVVHLRYQEGLADLVKDPGAGKAVRSSVIQFSFSFPFVH